MEKNKKGLQTDDDNLFNQIMFRFVPYWPLFAGLLVACVVASFVYLHYATPVYEISATLLIKDEKKGADDSKTTQSLDVFSTHNIVENEMEILQSRGLMNGVVTNLNLYAPIFKTGHVRSVSAYTSSPISVRIQKPNELDTTLKDKKIYFRYNSKRKLVNMENKNYPLYEWVNTAYGILKFSRNPNLKEPETGPFYFYLISPKYITNSLLENLEVTAPNKLSTIVRLTLEDENPKRGENILNKLIDDYTNAAINDKNEFAAKTLSIVSDRLTHVQNLVDSIQNLINQYKTKNGIVNLSEQSFVFLKNVGESDQKVADINVQAAILDEVEKYANAKDRNAGVIPSTLGINNPVLSNLLQKLYDLETNYEQLKMTATDNNPALVSLFNDIEKTRSNILENTRIQRISINASRSNLNTTLDTYSSELKKIPAKERELIEISRQLSVLNNTYDFLLQKKEEASLSYASAVGSSRTVDKAQSSIGPVSPQKFIVFLIAIAVALGIGSLIILGKEVFSAKILFRSAISEYTEIPVVAEILSIKNKNKRGITSDQKNTIINEQFRHLAAALKLYGRNVTKKKLLVTSSIAGEGKSFVSSNLAKSLALSGKKVILLDLDFRNPQVSRSFNLREEIGISEFLEGGREPDEIIKHSEQDNLFIAGAGSVSLEKAGELLLSKKLKELFTYLEETFDFIIVDTPPVEPISDAYILSEYCDTSLYVIRHRYTPKTIIRLLDQNNNIKDFQNIAIVFNAVEQRGFVKSSYGYGYSSKYGYAYHQKHS